MTGNKKAALLLIYTGGTIGMKKDIGEGTLKPFDFSQIAEQVPEIRQFSVDIKTHTFDPLIDSSDVEPSMWQKIATLIRDSYDLYDGFIVLHGTDTMAYSASALSFMLSNLGKPVIFTGSQLPVGVPRTDGKENLISAVEIASAKDSAGRPMVPEVCVYFNSQLMRGNRSVKVNSEEFSAFRSPNYPPLAQAGITIKYNKEYIMKAPEAGTPLQVDTELDTRVSILKLHPGITREVVRHILCGRESRAVIIETYGAGNAPTKEWFTDIVSEAAGMGKILVNVTQCLSGSVDMSIYATGKALQKAGVINGYDSTTESCLAKLFHLMGKTADNEKVKELMGKNLKGEISIF
ncbi:MAG: type I asparaginase [Bacteroidales bacterium]|nr:type I asparaginase [Bacteroidales bacterium]